MVSLPLDVIFYGEKVARGEGTGGGGSKRQTPTPAIFDDWTQRVTLRGLRKALFLGMFRELPVH